jgi:serine/threonine-protein kinase
MAEVYLAEQTSLKRNVALKVLRDDLVSESTHLRRFEQEATAAAGLNHPNIVQVYVVGKDNGTHFIAQEYVQGGNLREYLARKGTPELSVAIHIIKQVAMALQSAAEAGIVHRDIKPENIMITRQGRAKVADFGLAQLSEAGERVNLTQVGITMGTPLYMSPEQVNGKKVDQRSDIYSFGVTIYHLLTGRPPFRGETALAVAVQHLNSQAPPLKRLRPDIPPEFCAIVNRMMAKNPADRYPDAAGVLKAIADFERSCQGLSKVDRWDETSWGDGQRKSWVSRRTLLSAAGIVLVVGLSAGFGAWMRPSNPLDAPVTAKSKIEQQRTAAAQFRLAMELINDEEAWRAVWVYFGDDTPEARRAKEQLAMLYLRSGRYKPADELFEEFTRSTDSNALQALGIAGKAVVATLQGRYEDSQRLIMVELRRPTSEGEDRSLRDELSREMEELVKKSIETNTAHLKADSS